MDLVALGIRRWRRREQNGCGYYCNQARGCRVHDLCPCGLNLLGDEFHGIQPGVEIVDPAGFPI